MSTTNSNTYPIILEWMDQAICKNKTLLFFPTLGERPQTRKKRETEAKLICAQCPVMIQCRDHARNAREYGVWGGESEMDRELLGYPLSTMYVSRSRKARQLKLNSDHLQK
jgi:WhiB family redox-sensing transcriptional regulator